MSFAAADVSPEARVRVLFVDDEPQVLEGLQDSLRRWRHEWEMQFVVGGAAALDELEARPYDVIVSDMRMPGMDGAALLEQVQTRHPSAIRLILSGHSELESALRAAPVAHQFLAKPCDAVELRRVVDRALRLRSLLADDAIRRIATGARGLPSAPACYDELNRAIADPEGTVERVGELIEADPGMCAKVLQLVNSAFFGLGRRIENAREAAVYLGTTTLRSLVLSVEIFTSMRPSPPIEGLSVESLALHSGRVAKVASLLSTSRQDRESAFTAGLLHDTGKLLLATCRGDEMAKLLAVSAAESRPLHEVEAEVLGLTHAELGAYLLGLWGLPDPVVEAVAFHHAPERLSRHELDPTVIVYVANLLVDAAERACGEELRDEDRAFLEEADLITQLPEWRALTEEAMAE